MHSTISPGSWSGGGMSRGNKSRRVWLVVAGFAIVAVLAIAAVTCGTDEPSAAEPATADFAEMFGGDGAGSSRPSTDSSATTETAAGDIGIGFRDIIGGLWSGVSMVAGLVAGLLWALIWGILKSVSWLLAIVAFVLVSRATIRRSWYYERWNALPRAAGFGLLASVLPLAIWIFA